MHECREILYSFRAEFFYSKAKLNAKENTSSDSLGLENSLSSHYSTDCLFQKLTDESIVSLSLKFRNLITQNYSIYKLITRESITYENIIIHIQNNCPDLCKYLLGAPNNAKIVFHLATITMVFICKFFHMFSLLEESELFKTVTCILMANNYEYAVKVKNIISKLILSIDVFDPQTSSLDNSTRLYNQNKFQFTELIDLSFSIAKTGLNYVFAKHFECTLLFYELFDLFSNVIFDEMNITLPVHQNTYEYINSDKFLITDFESITSTDDQSSIVDNDSIKLTNDDNKLSRLRQAALRRNALFGINKAKVDYTTNNTTRKTTRTSTDSALSQYISYHTTKPSAGSTQIKVKKCDKNTNINVFIAYVLDKLNTDECNLRLISFLAQLLKVEQESASYQTSFTLLFNETVLQLKQLNISVKEWNILNSQTEDKNFNGDNLTKLRNLQLNLIDETFSLVCAVLLQSTRIIDTKSKFSISALMSLYEEQFSLPFSTRLTDCSFVPISISENSALHKYQPILHLISLSAFDSRVIRLASENSTDLYLIKSSNQHFLNLILSCSTLKNDNRNTVKSSFELNRTEGKASNDFITNKINNDCLNLIINKILLPSITIDNQLLSFETNFTSALIYLQEPSLDLSTITPEAYYLEVSLLIMLITQLKSLTQVVSNRMLSTDFTKQVFTNVFADLESANEDVIQRSESINKFTNLDRSFSVLTSDVPNDNYTGFTNVNTLTRVINKNSSDVVFSCQTLMLLSLLLKDNSFLKNATSDYSIFFDTISKVNFNQLANGLHFVDFINHMLSYHENKVNNYFFHVLIVLLIVFVLKQRYSNYENQNNATTLNKIYSLDYTSCLSRIEPEQKASLLALLANLQLLALCSYTMVNPSSNNTNNCNYNFNESDFNLQKTETYCINNQADSLTYSSGSFSNCPLLNANSRLLINICAEIEAVNKKSESKTNDKLPATPSINDTTILQNLYTAQITGLSSACLSLIFQCHSESSFIPSCTFFESSILPQLFTLECYTSSLLYDSLSGVITFINTIMSSEISYKNLSILDNARFMYFSKQLINKTSNWRKLLKLCLKIGFRDSRSSNCNNLLQNCLRLITRVHEIEDIFINPTSSLVINHTKEFSNVLVEPIIYLFTKDLESSNYEIALIDQYLSFMANAPYSPLVINSMWILCELLIDISSIELASHLADNRKSSSIMKKIVQFYLRGNVDHDASQLSSGKNTFTDNLHPNDVRKPQFSSFNKDQLVLTNNNNFITSLSPQIPCSQVNNFIASGNPMFSEINNNKHLYNIKNSQWLKDPKKPQQQSTFSLLIQTIGNISYCFLGSCDLGNSYHFKSRNEQLWRSVSEESVNTAQQDGSPLSFYVNSSFDKLNLVRIVNEILWLDTMQSFSINKYKFYLKVDEDLYSTLYALLRSVPSQRLIYLLIQIRMILSIKLALDRSKHSFRRIGFLTWPVETIFNFTTQYGVTKTKFNVSDISLFVDLVKMIDNTDALEKVSKQNEQLYFLSSYITSMVILLISSLITLSDSIITKVESCILPLMSAANKSVDNLRNVENIKVNKMSLISKSKLTLGVSALTLLNILLAVGVNTTQSLQASILKLTSNDCLYDIPQIDSEISLQFKFAQSLYDECLNITSLSIFDKIALLCISSYDKNFNFSNLIKVPHETYFTFLLDPIIDYLASNSINRTYIYSLAILSLIVANTSLQYRLLIKPFNNISHSSNFTYFMSNHMSTLIHCTTYYVSVFEHIVLRNLENSEALDLLFKSFDELVMCFATWYDEVQVTILENNNLFIRRKDIESVLGVLVRINNVYKLVTSKNCTLYIEKCTSLIDSIVKTDKQIILDCLKIK